MYPPSPLDGRDHPATAFVAMKELEHEDSILNLKPLKQSNHVVLAIDGLKILGDIESTVKKAEPLTCFTSVVPQCAYAYILTLQLTLEKLKKNLAEVDKTVKSIVVFKGCGFHPIHKPGMIPSRLQLPPTIVKRDASEKNGISLVDAKAVEGQRNRFYLEDDVEGFLVRHMKDKLRGIAEVMRAPYLVRPQISSFFCPTELVASETYGEIELLAFPGITRVITSIDPQKGTFKYVNKEDFIKACMEVNRTIKESDISSLLLIGSYVRDNEGKPPLTFIEMLEANVDLLIQRYKENPKQDAKDAMNARTRLRTCLAALEAPVLTVRNKLTLLSDLYSNVPRESCLKVALGYPLSTVVYYLLSCGPLLPGPYASASQVVISDQWPLVDSAHYRSEAEYIISLRAQLLHLVQPNRSESTLGRGDKRLWWQRDYNVSTCRLLTIGFPPKTVICSWNLANSAFQNVEKIYFYNVLDLATLSVVPSESHHCRLADVRCTIASVLLQTIDLLGYISHREGMGSVLSPIGASLKEFDCVTLSEYGLLFIELLRTKALTDDPITICYDKENKVYPPGARLAARLLSIVHINTKGPWKGPIDPEMAAFGQSSRILCQTLRSLAESLAASLFLKKQTLVPLEDFPLVVEELPFNFVPEFNAGILVMHIILDESSTFESLSETFPNLPYLHKDLCTLLYFWCTAYRAFGELVKDSEEQDSFDKLRPSFAHANALVTAAFARVLPNDLCEM